MSEETEGINLALSANAEVLTKMNSVLEKMLSKQEEDDEEEDMKKATLAKADERASLVKEIMKEMEGKFVSKEADSSEKKIDPTEKPDDQQDVIQASDDEDEKEEKMKKMKKMKKQDAEDDDKEEKQDEEEDKKDEEEEDKEYPEVEKLKKELDSLKKSMNDAIKKGIDDRFRRQGWREEKGLASPKRVELGVDGDPVLKKGMDREEKITELAKLDYGTLKKMEIAAETDALDPALKQFLT